MSAISYSLPVGGNLEGVTAGTLAPAAVGTVEIRFDQTPTAITDAQYPGGRAVKKGEVQALIRVLEEYLIRDTNPFQ
jgi:hypothetical protein